MTEDRHLLKRLRCGDADALRAIYEKYKNDLLTVAVSLLSDFHTAQDCLQDVFVGFAANSNKLNVRRNLKGYLLSCIVNRARDLLRKNAVPATRQLADSDCKGSQVGPVKQLIDGEQRARVFGALAKLPFEQREVVALRLQGDMTFRQIARLQGESINTAQSRYRYGIEKLRLLLKKEYEDETSE
jgi:RNA polymerase sigma-70 factor (ECF subfamily)